MPTENMAKSIATVIHARGETSMGELTQGDWKKLRSEIDDLFKRPGAQTIIFGPIRIKTDTPAQYPLPFEMPGEQPVQVPAG